MFYSLGPVSTTIYPDESKLLYCKSDSKVIDLPYLSFISYSI